MFVSIKHILKTQNKKLHIEAQPAPVGKNTHSVVTTQL